MNNKKRKQLEKLKNELESIMYNLEGLRNRADEVMDEIEYVKIQEEMFPEREAIGAFRVQDEEISFDAIESMENAMEGLDGIIDSIDETIEEFDDVFEHLEDAINV